MEQVRYGIIGLGNQGTFYLKKLATPGVVSGAVVTALCDINPARIEAARALVDFELAAFTDYKEMIASGLVDAILVETPHFLHPEISIYGLTHGVHVLCDKPAGVYTKQVKEMNEVANRSDRLFGLMFNQRTNCMYRKMREMILGGEIGEVKRINWIITTWFRSAAYYNSSSWRATWRGEGGGVLLNQCPHQLDLIQWVVGMMPKRIHAFCRFGQWHDIEVEDDVTAYLEYENGATGVFVTTTGEGGGTNRLEVVGNCGKLVAENSKLTLTKLAMGIKEYSETTDKAFGEPEKTVIEVETDGINEQHVGIFKNFTNAVLGKEKLFVFGQDGIDGVQIMDAMLLSAFLGRAVELPIDDELYLRELNKRIATGHIKVVEEKIADTEGSFGTASNK
ncbi:MAG: Gfo/Idh/MocA family oxidoreductase [Clostridia bacterium]|nr:Gfo/Idh/MocA family oxidoreductase [Clostridia bacterium]